MWRRFALVILVGLAGPGSGHVEADPASSCRALEKAGIEDVVLTRVHLQSSGEELPAYCQAEGVIAEKMGFVLRIPAEGWNGKFMVAGCGGFCGSLRPDKPGYSNSINGALKLGYAAMQTDGGHRAESWETDWAIDDLRALQLYAGEWLPLAEAAGRALVGALYGTAPRRTYFSGCSNGGRLGMVAAQRYPDLFDGIAAGGAIFDLTGNSGVHGLWLLQTTRDSRGRAVIDRRKLPLLAAHVMAQCDELDGVTDGVVARPELCSPELDSLRCRGAPDAGCFGADEIRAIERLYQGATVNGRQLFPGIPPGSEGLWSHWIVGTDEDHAWGERAAEGNLRLTYGIPSRLPFNPHDYVLEEELDNLQEYAPLLNATDPDLSALAAAGGKLFYYHGLADPLILAGRARQYYAEAEAAAAAGGQELDDYARFFMVPGHGHCWEQTGRVADDFDPLEIIDRWVETGEAPDAVIASHRDVNAGLPRSQKLCPYPEMSVFVHGDKNLANSYTCR